MKYKLINTETNEEHLCDKVTIDDFDYYVSDEVESRSGKIAYINNGIYKNELRIVTRAFGFDNLKDCQKVICTNNPTIDIPKVIDEADSIGYQWFVKADKKDTIFDFGWLNIFKGGYNKSQETYSNSDNDMIEFKEWCDKKENKGLFNLKNFESVTTKELLQIWKEQQTKTIYYG